MNRLEVTDFDYDALINELTGGGDGGSSSYAVPWSSTREAADFGAAQDQLAREYDYHIRALLNLRRRFGLDQKDLVVGDVVAKAQHLH